MLLLLVLAIGYGGYRIVLASSNWDAAGRNCYLPIVLILLATISLFLLTPVMQSYDRYKAQRGDVAVLCSEGVAYYHAGAWQHAKWNDIAEIRMFDDSGGKGLVNEGWQSVGPGGLYALFFTVIGGLWMLLGGDSRNYTLTTTTGERIDLGGTLKGIDGLIATIRSYSSAPFISVSHREPPGGW